MEKIKFSIIIPVYNAENYIGACIESILNQYYNLWELILVDDGSKDHSGEICDKYAKEDNRIHIFHKENGGVSSARNYGLKYVTGSYLIFVDADDLVLPYWLYEYYQCINKTNSDISFQDFSFTFNTDKLTENLTMPNVCFELIKSNDLESVFNKKWINFSATWSKCFRTKIIQENKISFINNLDLYEDFLFTSESINHSNIFSYVNYKGYLYRTVDNSLSRQYVKNKSNITKMVIDHLLKLSPTPNLLSCKKLFLKQIISDTSFVELPYTQQIGILLLAKKCKLSISYKRFIPFNLLIKWNVSVKLLRLYILCINKIKNNV